jgi:hypothetical protein
MSQVVKERPGKSSDIVTTRVFDALRELVFKAQTDPELFPQFWGPERYTTTVEKMEIRKGGVWRTGSVTLKTMSPPSTVCITRLPQNGPSTPGNGKACPDKCFLRP